ncbi:hypothetical protein BN80_188 [Yersinia phage phiR1-RT]|uniref:Ig-like domain-containing protein n=1 Tax=Yersinia phage phiR1-RT TaxID=1206558 RepID=I7J3Z0_BPPR1|nr:Hoc-like head decoration [Yersinia phage phiR1-RT]CCI88758.1 hypothetical protein BN80_188 [Yersinia phage phiR1-RT]
MTATVTGAPVGATITYVWKRNNNIISGQSSQTISVTEANVANYTLKCEATIVATDYTTAVLT